MKKTIVVLAVVVFMAIMPLTALAGSDIPDLKGEWVMRKDITLHSKKKEVHLESHVDVDKGFADVEVVITIDKQEGFRFSGFKASKKRKETVSGVIGFDNKTVYMVDDDGIMLCRIIGPDKMEQVYLHVTKQWSMASRAIMTRRR